MIFKPPNPYLRNKGFHYQFVDVISIKNKIYYYNLVQPIV